MRPAGAAGRARIVAIVGPTAAGKSELAVDLAQRLRGEVVSVDSRQVYRHLDIGTAKPSARLRATVPHHLLDVVDPDEAFDVARFRELGRVAIEGVLARHNAPILCGGSGLYLRALIEGLCPAPAADPTVRAELAREREERGLEALHRELARIDPPAAERIAPRDAVRITRALEVARVSGRPLSEWQREHRFADRPYDALVLVWSPEVAVLDRRIAARAQAMWDEGLVEETRAVLAAGYAGDLPPLRAIGYREAQAVLRGELSVESAVERMRIETRRYAKRQRTWFRGIADAEWLDGTQTVSAVRSRVERHLAVGR